MLIRYDIIGSHKKVSGIIKLGYLREFKNAFKINVYFFSEFAMVNSEKLLKFSILLNKFNYN